MGNQRRTLLERKVKDPRTRKSRRQKRQRFLNKNDAQDSERNSYDSQVTSSTPENPILDSSTPSLIPTRPCASERKIISSSLPSASSDFNLPDVHPKIVGELDVSSVTNSDREMAELDGNDFDNNSGYLFIDIGILFQVFEELIKCPRCGFPVESRLLTMRKQGLANQISIFCCSISCKWTHDFYTSSLFGGSGRGPKPFDINYRAQMAFREIGRGHDSIETFCGYMNMPAPANKSAFNKATEKLHPAYMQVVNENMQNSAKEIREVKNSNDDDGTIDKVNDVNDIDDTDGPDVDDSAESSEKESEASDIVDTTVSVDGSWQRRGFASLNGLVTAISIDTGKCLSFHCLVKICKACQIWEVKKKTDPEAYNNFLETHQCRVNHAGSAAGMETEGALNIFRRSEEELKLRFTTYIGDGDAKAYPAVSNDQPYGPKHPIRKGECVGHVQKRVGTRLRKYKKANLKKVLSDGKKLGGIGRLTDKCINRLQNYYGLAIRQNCHDLGKMRRAVGAVLYHCSEANDADSRHMFCDPNSGWCKYRIAHREGTEYTDNPGLPVAIRNEIKHIFQDLSSENLLKKCLHGFTQNNNESINGLIWKRLPKDVFVGAAIFHIGVASAVLNFNSGAFGVVKVMEELGMTPGHFTMNYFKDRYIARIKTMKRKSSEMGKKERKKRRAKRKGFQDMDEFVEGNVYGAGEF